MRLKNLMLLMAALFVSFSIYAQKLNSTLRGSVLGSGKRVALNEAVITLKSPELDGSRIALTDSSGNYNIPNLTAGKYTITFEMEGFKTVEQSEIVLAEGSTVGLNIEMAKTSGAGAKEKAGNKEKVVYVVYKQR